jgi:tRNA-Thr(GGU) m(6)t(6)A37 methyltransferase TsaA
MNKEKDLFQDIIYHPIGWVENGFQKPADPKKIRNSQSQLIIEERYLPALEGLERFNYLVVVFHMDRSSGYRELVHPMGDSALPKRGVLATRSPSRPNPLGLTVVEILDVIGNKILVTGLDALQGTPIIDIKPYEEHFDTPLGLERERDPSYHPIDGAKAPGT